MQSRIEDLPEKKLIGKRVKMSFAENRTADLWRGFMPRRKEIKNLDNDLYSVEIYPENFFEKFDPQRKFDKWAAVEANDFLEIPDPMEPLIIPPGKYAVFIHQGAVSDGEKTYRYIFSVWLPKSGYELDNRPHFALMGEKYKNDSPDSEEEIWIPVKLRK